MSNLTATERQEVQALAASGAVSICTYWPYARMALKLIRDRVPPEMQKLVDALIEAGDQLCPS